MARAEPSTASPAASTVVIAPSATASTTASTNTIASDASASASTSAAATPKLKRYGGKRGWKSGGDFSECKTCNWEMFYNDMGMRAVDTSACFAASEHEPPLHETPYFTVNVAESGQLTLVQVVGGAPNLDRCLFKVVESVGIKGGPGTAKFGFQGECTQGWAGKCD